MSSGNPARPPRRGAGGSSRRPGPSAGRGKPVRGRGGRPGDSRSRPAPKRPLTAAEQRAAEVRARRPPRTPRDPEAERAKIEARTREEWVDDGALRAEASDAASRAAATPRRSAPRRARAVDPETSGTIAAATHDAQRAALLTARLAQAQQALDAERFDEARRMAQALARELPDVAAVREVLGLTAYRTGRWQQAAVQLELAQTLQPSVALLPVLADVYRALRRFDDVERIWADVREQSPAPEILAEARIVAAGARADQGDLRGALRTMDRATGVPKRVRDHHLRQWYVLGDLHDRAGDPLEATRWFRLVAGHDPAFVDVADRLRALGR